MLLVNWCKLSDRSRRLPRVPAWIVVQTGQRAGEIELRSVVPGQIQDLLFILEYEVVMPLRSGQSMSRMAVLGFGVGIVIGANETAESDYLMERPVT